MLSRGLDVALYVRAREFFLMRKSFIQSSKPSNHTTNSAFGLGIPRIALYQIIPVQGKKMYIV